LNTKLKCLLLDDELPGLAYLKMLCEQIPDLEVVKAFDNPQTFLAEVPALTFDLCILDIEMPELNGLQVSRLLNEKPVIFTTAYKEYAVDAFNIDAIDYIQKPVKLERLHQAVAKAKKQIPVKEIPKPVMQVNTDKGKAIIPIDQLLYIRASEIDGRDKVAQLSDGSLLTLKNVSFEDLQQFLPVNNFVRINKKEIIALKAVQLFSFNEITTNILDKSGNVLKLALGEVYRNDFIRKVQF
jgi:DNA-binding LytR/AlgR family response regulator